MSLFNKLIVNLIYIKLIVTYFDASDVTVIYIYVFKVLK